MLQSIGSSVSIQALRQLSVSPARATETQQRVSTDLRPTAETEPSSAPVKTSSINPLDILPREATYGASNVAHVGLGAAVDADLSRDAASLHSLQIREQLGTQAQSIANNGPQAVAALFR